MDNAIRLRNGAGIGRRDLVQVARNGRLVETRGAHLEVGEWVALPFGAGFPARVLDERLHFSPVTAVAAAEG